MKIIIIALFLIVCIIGFAVSKTAKSNNKAAEVFFNSIEKSKKTDFVENPKLIFNQLFKNFKLGATEEIIRDTYAQKFYFNDTFRKLTDIEELVPYMIETANLTSLTTVDVLDVAKSDTDYYIRWVMEMQFEAKGKKIYSKSIGMTQLRFNDAGKIVFHQDYWDSTEGFYQHLPYIGYFVRKIRSKL